MKKKKETIQVSIEASQPSPYLEGQSVELKCINVNEKNLLNTKSHFKWYKNSIELNFNNSQRFKVCFIKFIFNY